MAKNKRQTSQIGLHGQMAGMAEKAGKTVNAIIIMGQPGKKTKEISNIKRKKINKMQK